MRRSIFFVVAIVLLAFLSLGMGPPAKSGSTMLSEKAQVKQDQEQGQNVVTHQDQTITVELTSTPHEAMCRDVFAKAPDTAAAIVYAVYIFKSSEKGALVPKDGRYLLTAIGSQATLSTA